MKARWILHNPDPKPPIIGQAIVAAWVPCRFYLVSTIYSDGRSDLARLTESLKTGKAFGEIACGEEGFFTQVFRCDRSGSVRAHDFNRDLYFKSYRTREEAQAGHKLVAELMEEQAS